LIDNYLKRVRALTYLHRDKDKCCNYNSKNK